jgi:probable O-glycosylation ligase (exosortase A-associated)
VGIRGILLAAIIFPSLPICIFRPFYGVVLWTVIAFTSVQWYTFSAYSVPWALVVAIPTIIGALLFGRGWRNVVSAPSILLIVFWIWCTLTTLNSVGTPIFAPHAEITMFRWTFVSKVMLMTVIAIAVVDTFDRLRTLVLVIAGCFGPFVVKSLPFLISQGGEDRVYGPEKSMIADNNDFGLALNMTLPLFFYMAQSETNPWVKRVFWGLTIATMPAIFFTYSRGALVGLFAIVGLMFLQLKQRNVLVPLFVAGLILAGVMAPQKWKERMDPTRKDAMDGSAYSRINAWTFSWRLACDYPIAGGGFETFTKALFDLYAPTPGDVHGPHSIYFGVLAEHGFFGLFLYFSMLVSVFVRMRRVLRWSRSVGDWVVANYARMFTVSLVGFMASGCFLGRQYFDYMFTIFACMVVLTHAAQERWAQHEEDEDGHDEAEVAA